MEQDHEIDFNQMKQMLKLPFNDVIIRTKSPHECWIFVVDHEKQIDHGALHSFTTMERPLAFESLFTELCLTYELPLNGYITASTPYNHVIKVMSKTRIDENTILLFGCRDINPRFPFYVCNFYTNSNPIMLDEIEFDKRYNSDPLLNSLSQAITLLSLDTLERTIGCVEKCILNKYNLVIS